MGYCNTTKYSVNNYIPYQFVVYICGHVFSCIAAVLTNDSSWNSALLQHKCITLLKDLFPYQHVYIITGIKKYIFILQ